MSRTKATLPAEPRHTCGARAAAAAGVSDTLPSILDGHMPTREGVGGVYSRRWWDRDRQTCTQLAMAMPCQESTAAVQLTCGGNSNLRPHPPWRCARVSS